MDLDFTRALYPPGGERLEWNSFRKWTSGGSVDEPVAQREFVVKFYITRVLEFNEDEGTPQGNRMCCHQCMMFCSRTREFTTPLYDDDDQLDALHNESPIHYRHINNGEAVPG
jgi:hypothetical protein